MNKFFQINHNIQDIILFANYMGGIPKTEDDLLEVLFKLNIMCKENNFTDETNWHLREINTSEQKQLLTTK